MTGCSDYRCQMGKGRQYPNSSIQSPTHRIFNKNSIKDHNGFLEPRRVSSTVLKNHHVASFTWEPMKRFYLQIRYSVRLRIMAEK